MKREVVGEGGKRRGVLGMGFGDRGLGYEDVRDWGMDIWGE